MLWTPKDLDARVAYVIEALRQSDPDSFDAHLRTLVEGPSDPQAQALIEAIAESSGSQARLKAVWVAGGPGSGKSWLVGHAFGVAAPKVGSQFKMHTFSALGFKVVTSDVILELLMKFPATRLKIANVTGNTSISRTDTKRYSPATDVFTDVVQKQLRPAAKAMAKGALDAGAPSGLMGGWLLERRGFIIETTGGGVADVRKEVEYLRSLGYDCYMLFVDVAVDVAVQRNSGRERKLDTEFVTFRNEEARKNKPAFEVIFGDNYYEIDNSDTRSAADVARIFGPDLFRWGRKIAGMPIKNQIGKDWLRERGLREGAAETFRLTKHLVGRMG